MMNSKKGAGASITLFVCVFSAIACVTGCDGAGDNTDTSPDSGYGDIDTDVDGDVDGDIDSDVDGDTHDEPPLSHNIGYAMDIDTTGNILVTGLSQETWTGANGEDPITGHVGLVEDEDVFVLKLDSSGEYLWHTFYGAPSSSDKGNSIVTDEMGNTYVTGYSDLSWNGPDDENPLNLISNEQSTVSHLFILKLDREGAYQWHTFYPTQNYEWFSYPKQILAVDSYDNLYLVGSSMYWEGPSGELPLQEPPENSTSQYLLKLNANGEYQWHTFVATGMYHNSLTSDMSDGIYLVGHSDSSGGPITGQSPLNTPSGETEIVVYRLDNTGAYHWHSFYGGADADKGSSISVDDNGNVLVAGSSEEGWVGPTGQPPLNSFDGSYSGRTDSFVLMLDEEGAYQWHSFFGSNRGNDTGCVAVFSENGQIYLAGASSHSWGANPLNAHEGPHNGNTFIVNLDHDGTYQWHTFHGASGANVGWSKVSNGDSGIVTAGTTWGRWYGPDDESPLYASGGTTTISIFQLNRDGEYDWHTFYGG
ncbi:MAG: hypothetical protein GY854_33050 [Deltaproteobacteria bacterium]|nr:hypothetical protein [Deltaproteobacteria bacterium]